MRRFPTGVCPSGLSPFVRIRFQGSPVSFVSTGSSQPGIFPHTRLQTPPLQAARSVLPSPLRTAGGSASSVPQFQGAGVLPLGSPKPRPHPHCRHCAIAVRLRDPTFPRPPPPSPEHPQKTPLAGDAPRYLGRAHLHNAEGKETLLPGAVQ